MAKSQSEESVLGNSVLLKSEMANSESQCDSEEEKYTFFWKSESPFSQWYKSIFTVDGVTYNCAEQYMMHQKALLFKDDEMAEAILQHDSPRKQKSLGRKVRNFDEETWNQHCRDIVKKGNYAKFSQSRKLKKILLETSGTVLAEASPCDTIWGIGYEEKHTNAQSKSTWRGTNWLGYALTDVREQIIQDAKDD